MKKKSLWIVGGLVVALAGWAFVTRGKSAAPQIDYVYSPVTRGEVVRSITATGLCVALTAVDVKSKAGGKVVKLAVDVGSVVKKGDLIALIDPSDTQATYDQAAADLTSSKAKASQSDTAYSMQVQDTKTSIQTAQESLDASVTNLQKAQIDATRQPELTKASVETAKSAYEAALASQDKLINVTIPQTRRDAQGTLARTTSALDAANADLRRQKDLLALGYVAQSTVDKALSTADAAQSDYDTAKQRMATLEPELAADTRAQTLAVQQAKAALDQATANSTQDQTAQKNLISARQQVKLAQIAYEKASADRRTNQIRKDDILAANAANVRNQVAVANAKVQLDSTTVVAPRDGVITLKYLEEGTIIPPGTSTFAAGTSLVQLSDVTQMYVDATVDEADIADVKKGQRVRVTADAYPGQRLEGVVFRVSPAAVTLNSITTVTVRVQVLPNQKVTLLPGMNATCEFITFAKGNVLVAPSQAVKQDSGGATVRVKTPGSTKPTTKSVVVGESGNEGIEIKSGLNEGDEVVTAEIDLQQLKELQQKMADQQQNQGGLSAGNQGKMPSSRASKAPAGKGAAKGGGK